MEENKNNQNTQGSTDQTVNNNSGNNTGNNNQNNNQQQNTQQNNQNTGGTGAQSRTFTQDDVNRMMTNEKNQGRAAAFREMGIDPNDTNTMNMFKAFLQAMQTPAQQQENQIAQQQIKIAEAEQRAKTAEAKAEAMQLGVDSQYVDDAVVIIMSKLDDKTDVKTIVAELKSKYPIWFKDSGSNQNQQNTKQQNQTTGGKGNNAGQNGTGSSVGNSGGDNKGKASGIGARLAAQRKVNNQKSSFWS